MLEDDVAHQVTLAVNAVGKTRYIRGTNVRIWTLKKASICGWFQTITQGAAWNSVQIAETFHGRGLVHPAAELKFELK